LPFPDFDPVLVQIGPFAIRWYALAYVAGILLGWRYVASLMRRQELWTPSPAPATGGQVDDLIVWLTLGIIVGGRLGHVLFYTPSLIWEDPLQIPQTWNGGMSFHGGAIGVLVAVLAFSRINKLDTLRLGDAVCAASPIIDTMIATTMPFRVPNTSTPTQAISAQRNSVVRTLRIWLNSDGLMSSNE